MLSCRVPSMLAKTQLRAAAANGLWSRSLSVSHPNPNIRTGQDQLWYRFHNAWPVQFPMTVQLPGTTSSEEGHPASAPVTKISQLPNGVRVISETSPSLGCSMGIFFGIGSRLETMENSGSSHFLQHLAFKATKQRSHFMLTREVEKIGAHVASAASRDCITYAGECLSKNAEGLFEILAESALYPRTEDLDMSVAAELVHRDLESMSDPNLSGKSGAGKSLESLHEVAFGGETLGAPLLCHPSMLSVINGKVIEDFVASTLAPARIVVSAVGVDHTRLVEMATKAFGSLPANSSVKPIATAKYIGGDLRAAAGANEVHMAIGFKGVSCTDPDLLAAAALQSLLGGGDSFSAGGPGKGLTSRLFLNVLSQKGVMSASGFSVSYQDTGLFGIQATSAPESAVKMVESVCAELTKLKKEPIPQDEVTRAINVTRSALLNNLESKGIVCEDLGRQVLYYGKRHSAAELSEQLTRLTGKDLSRVAGKMLSSPLSVAVHGNITACPPSNYIASLLG